MTAQDAIKRVLELLEATKPANVDPFVEIKAESEAFDFCVFAAQVAPRLALALEVAMKKCQATEETWDEINQIFEDKE